MIAADLRAWREARGLTQQQLADALQLPAASGRVQVARWEAGTYPVPPWMETALRGVEVETAAK